MLSYKGREPFHLFIKKYFSENKKHGSTDRKKISALCYDYFRLGMGVTVPMSMEEKFLLAMFLTTSTPSTTLEQFKPEYNSQVQLPLADKLELAKELFNIEKVFPFGKFLSDEITFDSFCKSFLKQPQLFIRARPGKADFVAEKLQTENIPYTQTGSAFELLPATKVHDFFKVDMDVVIQDFNSQQIASSFSMIPDKEFLEVWDCCAASGGKSILAFDFFKKMKLTVSDTRKPILQNLSARFSNAGIRDYSMETLDLSKALIPSFSKKTFDFIIADVPCSGSGVWARTPEQLHFFSKEKITGYAKLQKEIVTNALPALKPGGYLLYITCSAFTKENEENVKYFMETFNLELLNRQYFKGYEMRADTLFAALLQSK